jgi:hypothetical protein
LDVAKHIQRDPAADRLLSSGAVHRLLHLAMPAVASFRGVGGRTQQAIVQLGQCLLQVGRLEFLEDRSQSLEAMDVSPQPVQFRQRRRGATPAVEQPVDLLDHFPEGPQLGRAPADAPQDSPLTRRELTSHEEMTMLEQVSPHCRQGRCS